LTTGSALPTLPQSVSRGKPISWLHWFASATACQVARPPVRIRLERPALGDFYFQASNGSVSLPVAGYDYNSDWTPPVGGIDAPKFKLQRDGYAAAILNPRVIQAIRSGALGKIGVSFVEWSGVGAQKIVIDWTIIHDEASAKDFSAQVIEAPRAFADRTSISGGIDFAVAQLARSPYDAARRTIDISGDGNNNAGRDVTAARDEALAKGVTINGLVILTENPPYFGADHTNPPGGLENYYRNNVVGGPGAFVMVAENFSSFGQAILNKLIAEIAANPYPKQAQLR
jgi:hypothetical protein